MEDEKKKSRRFGGGEEVKWKVGMGGGSRSEGSD